MKKHTWYVTFEIPWRGTAVRGRRSRSTQTFETETEAKDFARAKFDEGLVIRRFAPAAAYPPQEASALMGYILTLRGAKDFARPEGLVSPHLLDRKRARRTYLVVDVRSPAEFRKAHISNAAHLPLRVLDSLPGPPSRLSCVIGSSSSTTKDRGCGRRRSGGLCFSRVTAVSRSSTAVSRDGSRRIARSRRQWPPSCPRGWSSTPRFSQNRRDSSRSSHLGCCDSTGARPRPTTGWRAPLPDRLPAFRGVQWPGALQAGERVGLPGPPRL